MLRRSVDGSGEGAPTGAVHPSAWGPLCVGLQPDGMKHRPKARFLSYTSQSGCLWLDLLTCIAIAAAVYGGVLRAIDWLFFAGVSATLVLYQIVNFHHYIVDAIIWRSPKPTPPCPPAHAG